MNLGSGYDAAIKKLPFPITVINVATHFSFVGYTIYGSFSVEHAYVRKI
jgi:hypothetical protein